MASLSGKFPIPHSHDRLAGYLEKGILRGRLRPGEQLPSEDALGRQFGLRRAGVREALQSLKPKGLIRSRAGSGSYVTRNAGKSPLRNSVEIYSALRREGASFLELLDLRLMVECFCIRRLADAAEAAARDRLRARLDAMERAAGDVGAFGEADIAFHLAIVTGARHELFADIMKGLLPGLGVRFMRDTYVETGLVEKILEEHRAIFRALEMGDGAAASALLRRHLVNSRRHLERLMKQTALKPKR